MKVVYFVINIAYKLRKGLEYLQISWIRINNYWNNNPNKSNLVLGVAYRHPIMDLNEFNDKHGNKLSDSTAK